MKGKFWRDHLLRGYIEVKGKAWDLTHLRSHHHTMSIPGVPGKPEVRLRLQIEYSSHCVSKGAKQGATLDFDTLGFDHLIIDHRSVRRAFDAHRYELSLGLPAVIMTLDRRQCLFTGHSNWLTLEGAELGLPDDLTYEIYFSVRRESADALKVHVESAYVRDPAHPNGRPAQFKRYEKIKGWLLLLKKLRNEPIRRPGR